jgi:hypothetical protein
MKSRKKPTNSQTESTRQIGLVEEMLIENGIPVTRENWIRIAYAGEPPKEWGQELENELPRHLRSETWWLEDYP